MYFFCAGSRVADRPLQMQLEEQRGWVNDGGFVVMFTVIRHF